ncbi:MAG: hypothetical protein IT380_04025 [Myxococcales bacterium]|nr:hypothetical protein [Myxococcales bacterium]
MKRTLMMLVPAVLSLTACGGGRTDLVGSYTGTTTYTWEQNSYTTTLQTTVDIFDSPDGSLEIVGTARRSDAPPSEPALTCRIKGKPTSSGFEIEPGASCILEGFPGDNCGAAKATAAVVSASAVKTALGLTINVRAQVQCQGDPEFVNLRASLTKNL